jgi:hypothetical protein
MPYKNVPESEWGKMDDCVDKVGGDKDTAIAICYDSIMGTKESRTSNDWSFESLMGKVAAWIDSVKAGARHSAADLKDFQGVHDIMVAHGASCMSVKEVGGKWRWTIISSSAFIDRDREIIPQKTQEADVAWMDRYKQYGPLLWWHEPSAILGDCDFSAMHGKMRIESGTFRDPRVAQSVKEKADTLGASIRFLHPENEPGTKKEFSITRTFERSLLPFGAASNILTAVPLINKETIMDAKKETALLELLGGDQDALKSVLETASNSQKAAESLGITSKAKADDKKAKMGAEGSQEEESTEGPDEAAVEGDETKPAKKTKKEATVGDMTVAQLTQLVADTVKAVNDPSTAKAVQLETQVTELGANFAKVGESVTKMATTLAETQKTVKELSELQPRGSGFRPSIDPATITNTQKAGPSADAGWGGLGALVDAMDGKKPA